MFPSVARLIAHMKPPWEIPQDADRKYGAYELVARGQSENGDFRYLVQLPPEYDPISALSYASSAERSLQ